ncbi:MAG: TolC family protein [Bacteroidia bacterium]|jgi:outer membrane protein|nr:TolC family protein [Bacteroidia bacterium]
MKKVLFFILFCFLISTGTVLSQQKVWPLEDCIRYAIDNNIQIKQQVVQTEMQKNTLALSKLKLLPSLNAQVTNDFSFGRALDLLRYEYIDQNMLNDRFYVGGDLTLFQGLINYNTIRKNKYELLAGEQNLQYIKDNISLNIALAYLQILLNKELVNANSSQLQITRQQIEKTRKMVDAGSVARGNLLQIEAQAAQEEVSLINMKNQLDISYLTLTQMLELKSPEGFEIVIPVISVDTASVITGKIDDIYNLALSNRPEIKSAELKLESSKYDLKIARGGRYPSLTSSHSFGTRYSYIFNDTSNVSFKEQIKNYRNYGIGITLSVPILNGWQVNKNIKNAKLGILNSEYTLEAERKGLYKNIQQAYADAVASLKKYNASMKAVASTQESFRYTEQKFNVGMVTSVDYNAAKTQLLNAQSDMSQSKYTYIFKTKVLDFYKGLPLTLTK